MEGFMEALTVAFQAICRGEWPLGQRGIFETEGEYPKIKTRDAKRILVSTLRQHGFNEHWFETQAGSREQNAIKHCGMVGYACNQFPELITKVDKNCCFIEGNKIQDVLISVVTLDRSLRPGKLYLETDNVTNDRRDQRRQRRRETPEWYDVYLSKTEHWKGVRELYLHQLFYSRSLGPCCMKCFEPVDVSEGAGEADFHHKWYTSLGFEVSADLDLLCKDCHLIVHESWEHDLIMRTFPSKIPPGVYRVLKSEGLM